MENFTYNYIEVGDKEYVGIKGFSEDNLIVALYDSAPAIKNNLTGAIIEINGNTVNSLETLTFELEKYSPGETVNVLTMAQEGEKSFEIALEENPEKAGKSFIGIVTLNPQKTGIVDTLISKLTSFKDPNIYYESKMGDLGIFIYDLFWWMILISISVALVNMLPVGIFDGGRFFHLTIWGITRREKIADKAFQFITWIFLLAIAVLMFFWAKALF